MSKIIRLTETVLRDGQQSQIATRMSTEDMLPILETLDQAGFHALEVWGGATFDSCIRFLNEDPWERLRQIRAAVKDTTKYKACFNAVFNHCFTDETSCSKRSSTCTSLE